MALKQDAEIKYTRLFRVDSVGILPKVTSEKVLLETTLRVSVIGDATVVVRAKMVHEKTFTDLQTVTADSTELIDISTYDMLEYEVTSVTGNAQVAAAGFFFLNNTQIIADAIQAERDKLGWAQFTDSQYTSASPLTIPANTRTLLPNNANGILNPFGPPTSSGWITAGTFNPDAVGDFYLIRTTLTVDPTLNNRNFTVELDIGDGITPINIWSQTYRLARGAGVNTPLSIVIPVYTLSTFLANGGKVYVTCDGEINVFDIVNLTEKTSSGV